VLSAFKNSLKRLEVYDRDDLKKEYDMEEQRARSGCDAEEADGAKATTYELKELMQMLDEPQQPTPAQDSQSIDEMIVEIRKKLAELERAEKAQENEDAGFGEKIKNIFSRQFNICDLLPKPDAKKSKMQSSEQQNDRDLPMPWIIGLAPKQNFSIRFCRIYLETLLSEIAYNREDNLSHFLGNNRFYWHTLRFPNTSMRYIGVLLLNILEAIFLQSTDIVKENVKKAKLVIRKEIRRFAENARFTADDLELMRFYRDVLFVVLSISDCGIRQNQDLIWTEAHTYICFYVASNFCYRKGSAPSEGLFYAKKGLAISNPEERQEAFNVLGLCAIESRGCKQLAYDVYYSWIHQKIIGEIIPLLPTEYEFGQEDEDWRRKEGTEPTSLMYANYAYVCGTIADTYERGETRGSAFYSIAIEYIQKAISLHESSAYHCTYATLLSDISVIDSSFDEILKQYKKSHNSAKESEDKISLQKCIIITMMDQLQADLYRWVNENNGSIEAWAKDSSSAPLFNNLMEELRNYQSSLAKAANNPLVDSSEKQNRWQQFIELCKSLPDKDEISKIEIKLLMIEKASQTIMNLLKRREYSSTNYYTRIDEKDNGILQRRLGVKPIAYYTTLSTAAHLFDVLHRERKGVAPSLVGKDKESQYRDGVNCLTMMHAHYMNDPCEGMALADYVGGTNPHANILFYRGNAEKFRDDIFKQYYVFLKSFTDKMDDLLMWNRYASDRNSDSKDSNGCCIQFNTDFFDKVNDSEDSIKDKFLDDEDNYALYRVVYISRDGNIRENKNPDLSPYVVGCYNMLIKLLRDVNEDLNGIPKKEIDWIRSFVQSAVREVIFLFKHDDYADEAEYRLVVTRPQDSPNGIRLIPSEPDMLCVNPYFQICIDRIILGPNVAKTAHWTTFFQYQLTLMWKRALKLTGNNQIPKFSIEKSIIHYHT
jgi:hypothetical protein